MTLFLVMAAYGANAFETKDQLASSIGHELGHAALKHHEAIAQHRLQLCEKWIKNNIPANQRRRASDKQKAEICSRQKSIDADMKTWLPTIETEADDYGMDLMSCAGYDPAAIKDHWFITADIVSVEKSISGIEAFKNETPNHSSINKRAIRRANRPNPCQKIP